MNRVGLGLAVGAGYFLGRTKKLKLAFAVGTLVAGKRMNLSPKMLADLASQQLRNNPQFKEIGDQLREDMRGVGKAASGAMLERQLDAFADRLHGRTAQVRDQLSGVVPNLDSEDSEDREDSEEYEEEDEAAEGYDDRDAEGYEDDADEDDEPEQRAPRKKAPPAKKAEAKKTAPAKKTAKKTVPAQQGSAAKTASAGKKTARKTVGKKAPAARGARSKGGEGR
ncbi:DNA primase [Streptomyces sp. NPDC002776]